MSEQTLGEYRVGTAFNPSADSLVDDVKRAQADFIDQVEDVKQSARDSALTQEQAGEKMRLCALAQTYAETAAMYAVKAITRGARSLNDVRQCRRYDGPFWLSRNRRCRGERRRA